MDLPPLKKKTSKNGLLREEVFLDRKITRDTPTNKFIVLFNVLYTFPDSNVLNIAKYSYPYFLSDTVHDTTVHRAASVALCCTTTVTPSRGKRSFQYDLFFCCVYTLYKTVYCIHTPYYNKKYMHSCHFNN